MVLFAPQMTLGKQKGSSLERSCNHAIKKRLRFISGRRYECIIAVWPLTTGTVSCSQAAEREDGLSCDTVGPLNLTSVFPSHSYTSLCFGRFFKYLGEVWINVILDIKSSEVWFAKHNIFLCSLKSSCVSASRFFFPLHNPVSLVGCSMCK